MSCDLWREWLDAYVDDGCSAEETAGIEDHLRNCNSCAAEALHRLQLKRATRAAAAARYTPSAEFRQRIEKNIQPSRKPLWTIAWVQGLTAVTAAFLLVLISVALHARHSAREQAVAELLDLHVATLASANPIDVVSTDRHTVKPWFQGKLPFAFNLPEMQNSPFKLLGGRLMYFKHSPGAHLLFELGKHRLSVFILQDQPGMGVSTTSVKGFSVEAWSEAGLRYVVISDTDPTDVHALSELLRTAARQ
jgi:anti-sigma factor RsiW